MEKSVKLEGNLAKISIKVLKYAYPSARNSMCRKEGHMLENHSSRL